MNMSFLAEQYAPFLYRYGPVILPASVCVGFLSWLSAKITTSMKDEKSSEGSTRRDSQGSCGDTSSCSSTDEDDGKVEVDDKEGLVFNATKRSDSECLEDEVPHVLYKPVTYCEDVMIQRSRRFYQEMNKRRSVRFISDKPVPKEVLQNIIKTAGTSPSGAHTEPWTFVVVSNLEVKQQVRDIIEEEEKENYQRRMGDKWVEALKPIKTTWMKPYLTTAPHIIIIFKQTYGRNEDGTRKEHYYNEISASISAGFLLAAIQNAGLCTVTTTPLNAGTRLRKLLNRPSNEKVLLLLPLGYCEEGASIPEFYRKPLEEIMVTFD